MPAVAPAAGPPAEDSVAGAVATARLALVVAALLPPDAGAAHEALGRARARCAALDGDAACAADPVAGCAEALGAVFDALAPVVADDDPLTADLALTARQATGDAVSRLAWARDAIAAGRCDALAPPGEVPARLVPGAGGSLEVRPLRALRAGRPYALVATGLPSADLAALRRSAAPGGEAGGAQPGDADRSRSAREPATLVAAPVAPRDVLARYDRRFAGRPARFRGAEARDLVRRLAELGAAAPAGGAAAGLRLDLGRALAAKDLATWRLAYAPARAAAPETTIVRLRTPDVRAPYAARRARLRAHACRYDGDRRPLERADVRLPGDAALVLRGSTASIDVRSDGPSQVPSAPSGAPVRVPFLLALPRAWDAATPLVLLVHGHAASAETFLRSMAPGLVARGLAALAIELPGHGARESEGPFLDLLAPEGLQGAVAQAATDALALVARARGCGFVLPGGRTYRPSAVLYLGYSVGSMVGTIVRAVEPELGATVLLAPGGELVEWPVAQVPKRLGAESYKVCRGGPRHGAWCAPGDACPAPGVCVPDPQVILLREALRFPYAHALAGVEPMAFAAERTGAASTAPLLLLAGGKDFTLTPLMAARLADAYGMKPAPDGGRRGPHARLAWWPDLGHELVADPRVVAQAQDFLAAHAARRAGADQPPAAVPR